MTPNATTAPSVRFAPKELPYAYDAIAPAVSGETMRYHHDKHYAGYVAKLNELVPGTPYEGKTLEAIVCTADGAIYNNAAQMWNHEFFFDQFAAAPQPAPKGALLAAIEAAFGSLEQFEAKMTATAVGLFGSGWAWLVADRQGALSIVPMPNAGNPLREGLTPLLCIDVWEHAYYIDYRNRRADAVAALWSHIDWRTIERRYGR